MSGKTSLSQLLERYLLTTPNVRIFRISILWMGLPNGSWAFEDGFSELMGVTWQDFVKECQDIKTVLILDEVQV